MDDQRLLGAIARGGDTLERVGVKALLACRRLLVGELEVGDLAGVDQ
jgi:hypothetical protein